MNQPTLVVLRPGDKVLVALAGEPDADTAAQVLRLLRKDFPKVDFTLVTGVSGIAVQPPDGR